MLVIEGGMNPLATKKRLCGHFLGGLEDKFRSAVHEVDEPERSERFSVSSMVIILPSFVKLLMNELSRTYHPTRVSVIIGESSCFPSITGTSFLRIRRVNRHTRDG